MPAGLAVMVVEAAGIAFALPALAVAHVTAPVPVTPLPSVPGYVDGLVGLGGRILPQIDLRRRLALPAAAAGAAGDLVVVMADEGSYALRVDRVVTVTTVAPDVIPVFEAGPASGGVRGLTPGLVTGELPWRQGRTVLLLHPDRLGLQEPVTRGGGSGGGDGSGRLARGTALAPSTPVEPHQDYVVARCGPGYFAVPVGQVAEVVAAGTVTPVPGAPAEWVGLVQVRGRPLPVLAPVVRAWAGTGIAPPGILMVVDSGCGRFALPVDGVIGVRRFPLSRIHADAAAGAGAGYMVDTEDRVIGLLDVDRLAAFGGGRATLPLVPASAASAEGEESTRQVLLFRVGPEWYALDVGAVVRLTSYRTPVPLPVPASATGLAGVVEIGAEVLPTIDLRTAMAVPAVVDDWTAMIVVAGGDGPWVMVVDRIDRLAVVPASAVQPAEASVHPRVSHMLRVGHHLVSLLDHTALLKV